MPCTDNSQVKYLFIRGPATSTLDEFVIPTGFRSGQYLKLPVNAAEYTRLVEGEKPKLVTTFNQSYFSPRTARVGFSVQSSITEYNIFAFIEYVAKISASTSYTQYTAIQIYDFVRPEVEDIRAALMASADPMTVRYGMINVGEGNGFSGYAGKQIYLDSNFSFSFMESSTRLIV